MSGPPASSPDERSLGDILGDALRPSSEEPFDPLKFVLGHMAEVLKPPRKQEADPFVTAMGTVATATAEALNVRHEDALMALYTIPDNMMSLLDSPEGWTALAEYVAQCLKVASSPLRVTRH